MSSLQFKERRLYCVDLTIYWDDIPFSINLSKRATSLKTAFSQIIISRGAMRGGRVRNRKWNCERKIEKEEGEKICQRDRHLDVKAAGGECVI